MLSSGLHFPQQILCLLRSETEFELLSLGACPETEAKFKTWSPSQTGTTPVQAGPVSCEFELLYYGISSAHSGPLPKHCEIAQWSLHSRQYLPRPMADVEILWEEPRQPISRSGRQGAIGSNDEVI